MKYIVFYIIAMLFIALFIVNKSEAAPIWGLEASKLAYVQRINEFNRIGQCESAGDLHAKNRYSSASGEYQFIWSTWHRYGLELWGDEFYEKNIWSDDNRELAWYVYSKYGSRDWDASKSCWYKSTVV